MPLRFAVVVWLCLPAMLLTSFASRAEADITFSVDVLAEFELMILEDGPLAEFFPAGEFLPFQARGVLEFSLVDSVNDPEVDSAAFTNVTGTLTGQSPAAFLPFAISPFEFVSGDLTNIVRNAQGDVTDAQVSGLSMNWELLASLAGSDIRIYTRGGLPFSGTVENIPFLNGTQLTGNDEFDGFLQEGSTPDASDPAAVTGRNRTLTAVPEPGAALGLALLGSLAWVWRRRRSC